MSLALIDEVLLRILSDPTYTAKGSPLTWTELDTDLKILADAIKELAAVPDAGGGFDEYDNAETYEDGDFVSYTGNIWKYIGALPDSGVTPGSDPTKWEISSVGQFSHEKNKDQYLDFGGTYQISAQDIYSFINTPITLEWQDIIGDPEDSTTLVSYLESDYYPLNGDNPLEGDMDFDGYDINNLAKIINVGDADYSLNFINRQAKSSDGNDSYNWEVRYWQNSSNQVTGNWQSQDLFYTSGNSSLNWESGLAKASNGYFSYHYNQRLFYTEISAASVATLSYANGDFIEVIVGDLKITGATKGLELWDRTLNAYYRVFLNNGILGVETV